MLLSEWCDSHGERGQQIKSEWTGKDEYGRIYSLDRITHGSGKKMLWVCKNNKEHRWYAKVMHRTNVNSGCPMCSREQQSKRSTVSRLKRGINDLYTWCLNNEFGSVLLDEFQGKLEDGTTIEISDISYGSTKKVLWKCSKGHEWYATVGSRTNTECKCPYCSGNKLLSDVNSFKAWCINNNRLDLLEQYCGIDEHDNLINADDISYGSHKKMMWKHRLNNKDEHKWFASIKHRTLCDSGCPICNSKKVLPGFNDLNTWCNRNGLFGDMLRAQFSGLDEFGDIVDIEDITPNSYRKIVWVHYTADGELHTWNAAVYNRTVHMSGCPLCNSKSTSLPEQLLYRCIKQVYPNTISRGKFQGYEFDITIPEIRTCIEYGSYYYHKDREHRDLEKKQLCNKHGVRFISILDSSGSDLPDKFEDNSIVCTINSDAKLRIITVALLKTLNIDLNKVNYNKALEESLDFMRK